MSSNEAFARAAAAFESGLEDGGSFVAKPSGPPKPFPNPFQQNNVTDDSGSFVFASKAPINNNSGDDGGTFVVSGGISDGNQKKLFGKQPTSIEEAAASLAASMGMEVDNPYLANRMDSLTTNSEKETISAWEEEEPSSEEDEADPDPLFSKVDLPRPVFFGSAVPSVIQQEYESWTRQLTHGSAFGKRLFHDSWASGPPVGTSSSGSSESDDEEVCEDDSHTSSPAIGANHSSEANLVAGENALPYFLQDPSLTWDHPSLKNLHGALVTFAKMQQFTTYVPQWTNSWDKIYKKQRYWNRIVTARAASTVPLNNAAIQEAPSALNSSFSIPASKLDISTHTPLYSCDDTSLPTEADLGQFDTNEEKVKSQNEREIQLQLERVFPEVFRANVIKNPSPCRDANDSTSWNNRDYVAPPNPIPQGQGASHYYCGIAPPGGSTIPSSTDQQAGGTTGGNTDGSLTGTGAHNSLPESSSVANAGAGTSNKSTNMTNDALKVAASRGGNADGVASVASGAAGQQSISPGSVKSLATTAQQRAAAAAAAASDARKKNIRIGWWNKEDVSSSTPTSKESSKDSVSSESKSFDDAPYPILVKDASAAADPFLRSGTGGANQLLNYNLCTLIPPSVLQLRQHNLPLNLLNQTYTLASTLPFMCDRPPSWRYLQIDTQTVSFATTSPVLTGSNNAGTTGANSVPSGAGPAPGIANPNQVPAAAISTNGEIEPLFCSMAIYHVESVISLVHNQDDAQSIDSTSHTSADGTQVSSSVLSSGGRAATQRGRLVWNKCGRVTEALRFDVVNDPAVAEKCSKSVWPYNVAAAVDQGSEDGLALDRRLEDVTKAQGTRCGVFPLPASLDIANLYAVLIVHKVLSDESELEPYLKASKAQTSTMINQLRHPSTSTDVGKLRSKAQKTSEKLGMFLTPFAFGVAPLRQAIGDDVPANVPTSRAVQIPLFKMEAGQGDRPILDHVMAIRYPKSEYMSSGGITAELTKGGKAMLVMRNFGYLGLHCVVDPKSSLAKDRLVDFTCERQIRRKDFSPVRSGTKGTDAISVTVEEYDKPDDVGDAWSDKKAPSPSWGSKYVNEATILGGRRPGSEHTVALQQSGMNRKKIPSYAQELAPIPLSYNIPFLPATHTPQQQGNVRQYNPSGRGNFSGPSQYSGNYQYQHGSTSKDPQKRSDSTGSATSQGVTAVAGAGLSSPPNHTATSTDAEPIWNSSIYNEMLLHPRLIHNCRKRNICLSLEVRKLVVVEDTSAVLALPLPRPHIHNPRRGPWLVHTAFSNCAYHVVDPQFLDEFKVKLPTILEPGHVLVFNVYNVSVKGKKKLSNFFPDSSPSRASKSSKLNNAETNKDQENSSSQTLSKVVTDKFWIEDMSSASSAWWTSQHHCELIGCGVLPLANVKPARYNDQNKNETMDTTSKTFHPNRNVYLLANDLHDVNVAFVPRKVDHMILTAEHKFGNAADGSTQSDDVSMDSDRQSVSSGKERVHLRKGSNNLNNPLKATGSGGNAASFFEKGEHLNQNQVDIEKKFDWHLIDAVSLLPTIMNRSALDVVARGDLSKLPDSTVLLAPRLTATSGPSNRLNADPGHLENRYEDITSGFTEQETYDTIPRRRVQGNEVGASSPSHQSAKTHIYPMASSASAKSVGSQQLGFVGQHQFPLNSDSMILQVRSIALSSVHCQNETLAEFFGWGAPCFPKSGAAPVNDVEKQAEEENCMQVTDLEQDEGVSSMNPLTLKIPAQSSYDEDEVDVMSSKQEALILVLLDLAKASTCPTIELVQHFHRITSQLLFLCISGYEGVHDAEYANPKALVPLRLHSFSTLLNIWWQVVLFLQKCGVKQLDGRRKWNIHVLAKAISLVFHENPFNVNLEVYSPDIEEEDTTSKISDCVQNDGQSSVEILPVVQEEPIAPPSAPPANSSDVVFLKKGKGMPELLRPGLKRDVTPFPSTLSHFPAIRGKRSPSKNFPVTKQLEKPIEDTLVDEEMFKALLKADPYKPYSNSIDDKPDKSIAGGAMMDNDSFMKAMRGDAWNRTAVSSTSQLLDNDSFVKAMQGDDWFGKEGYSTSNSIVEKDSFIKAMQGDAWFGTEGYSNSNSIVDNEVFIKLMQGGGDDGFGKSPPKARHLSPEADANKLFVDNKFLGLINVSGAEAIPPPARHRRKPSCDNFFNEDRSSSKKDLKSLSVSPVYPPLVGGELNETISDAPLHTVVDNSTFLSLLQSNHANDVASGDKMLATASLAKKQSRGRHMRTITPMGSLTDMLSAADESDVFNNENSGKNGITLELTTSIKNVGPNDSSTVNSDDTQCTAPESSSSQNQSVSSSVDTWSSISSSGNFLSSSDHLTTDLEEKKTASPKPGLDSKYDFQNLLKQATFEEENKVDSGKPPNDLMNSGSSRQNLNLASMSFHSSNRRKWLTLPTTSALDTIQEDIEGEEAKSPRRVLGQKVSAEAFNTSNPLPVEDVTEDSRDANKQEIHVTPRKAPKQFRIPRKSGTTDFSGFGASSSHDPMSFNNETQLESNAAKLETNDPVTEFADSENASSSGARRGRGRSQLSNKESKPVLKLATDDEIENAGTAFLDKIGKNLGMSVATKDMAGEERLVGQAHHRKTRSRCSIDWTLPPPDLIQGHRQRMGMYGHGRLLCFENNGDDVEDASASSNGNNSSEEDEIIVGNVACTGSDVFSSVASGTHEIDTKLRASPYAWTNEEAYDLAESSRAGDKSNDGTSTVHTSSTGPRNSSYFKNAALSAAHPRIKYIKLTGYDVRLSKGFFNKQWWPYVYEVVLYTWVTLLLEQTRNSDPSGGTTPITSGARKRTATSQRHVHALSAGVEGTPPYTVPEQTNLYPVQSKQIQKVLSENATRAKGVTISCSPILFELVKKSLAERVRNLLLQRHRQHLRQPESISDVQLGSMKNREKLSSVVSLDEDLFKTLQILVRLITDASIDSRNLDSQSFRQTSSDVNDTLVMFMRDLYSLIHPAQVHRLICIYFSRYILKEGKQWLNRDSKIGLRCSWETTKIRLNAVTLLIRFPDFVKVNAPLLEQIDTRRRHSRKFYGQLLEFIQNDLCVMSPFAASETQTPIRRRGAPVGGVGMRPSGRPPGLAIPTFQPHWLAELVTDICLAASGHAEHSISTRASSLLCELFWMHHIESKSKDKLAQVGGMYISFITKILDFMGHLACVPPRSQIRKDLLPCVIFVMQCAPGGLLCALWRQLIRRMAGRGTEGNEGNDSTGGIPRHNSFDDQPPPPPAESGASVSSWDKTEVTMDEDDKPTILDVFGLLNLALKTFEYEGAENLDEVNEGDDSSARDQDFISSEEKDPLEDVLGRRSRVAAMYNRGLPKASNEGDKARAPKFSTAASRKWHSHDGAVVVINTTRSIVHETLFMLRPASKHDSATYSSDTLNRAATNPQAQIHLKDIMSSAASVGSSKRNSEKSRKRRRQKSTEDTNEDLKFSVGDTILFVRATTSVYLHALSLRQSDAVVVKTLVATVEILKIFGIKIFLSAVGETLQHWMRVALMWGGARRANVRVQALEFLAFMLRLSWDSYGSLYRIRVPLLAVQLEVMERIVAQAARRHCYEQRKLGKPADFLSNDAAEASLSPLWRTLDRLHHQSASRNIAFRASLGNLAEKMKKLYRAYIAAHALSIADRLRTNPPPKPDPDQNPYELSLRADRLRKLTSLSAGFGRQFLGLLSSIESGEAVTHDEAVEDAFLAAANVFSSMELPSHRVAWLEKLSEFHKSRGKFAEEASCHYSIHITFRQASRMDESLWCNGHFSPWIEDTEGIHPYGEGPIGGSFQYGSGYDDLEDSMDDFDYDRNDENNVEKTDSFRRLFRRQANSVMMRTGDFEGTGQRTLFFGVARPSEYTSFTQWLSLRQMEDAMVEEAENAGDLFLRAGIVENSRTSWSIATRFHAERYDYVRLANVYRMLSQVVASQVPVVDTSNPLELYSPLGRFYRVWFHGSAPDELIGAEFVYRASVSVKLEEFGKKVSHVLGSLLPEGTPIDLVLDDGRPEEAVKKRPARIRVAPIRIDTRNRDLGVCQIKVTPLRPIIKGENNLRGSAEWFHRLCESSAFSNISSDRSIYGNENRSIVSSKFSNPLDEASRHTASAPHHRAGKRVNETDRGSSVVGLSQAGCSSSRNFGSIAIAHGNTNLSLNKEIMGVDTFTFTHPVRKDRRHGARDWFKTAGPVADKSLRVTKLQVDECFPSCVSRQPVTTRSVHYQSPLEAGVEAVCSWCSVLFRTAVATKGQAVLGASSDQGIGSLAAKVVADCIHCSRVKDMAYALLSSGSNFVSDKEDSGSGILPGGHGKLSDDEVMNYQATLARSIVVFMELLHLLIARNRDILLAVVQEHKRRSNIKSSAASAHSNPPSPDNAARMSRASRKIGSTNSAAGQSMSQSDAFSTVDPENGENGSVASGSAGKGVGGKTDAAIAIQRELQRAFISLAKLMHPLISNVIFSETPKWLKQCTQDQYFFSGAYRNTKLSITEELVFFMDDGSLNHPTNGLAPLADVSIVSTENGAASIGNSRSFSPSGSHGGGSVVSRNSDVSKQRARSPSRSIAGSLRSFV